MAKVRARSDNQRLFFDFYFLGERFREQTLLTDSRENRRNAERMLKQIEAEIAVGIFEYEKYFPKSENVAKVKAIQAQKDQQALSAPFVLGVSKLPTVRQFVQVWLTENEVRWRDKTRAFMRSHLDTPYVLDEIGGKRVDTVSRTDLIALRTKLARIPARKPGTTLAPRTINAYISTVKSLLNEAADRYQFTAPTGRLPGLKIPKSDVQPFSLEEVFKVIEAMPLEYRYYVTARFFTGLRTGEADGLKWSRIDWHRRQIDVAETYSHGKTEIPKTEESIRFIDMNGLVYDALMAQKRLTGQRSEYVFCNSVGGPIDNKNFTSRVWNPTLQKLGLRRRRPYQMRHTAATLWLASGEAPEWIAKQLGHSNTQMLFTVYSRFVPNLTRRDGAAFEQMMAANGHIKTAHAPVSGGEV